MRRLIAIAGILSASALGFLVGCGSDDSDDGTQPAGTGGSSGAATGGAAGAAGGAAGMAGDSAGGAAGMAGAAGEAGSAGTAGSAGAPAGQAFLPDVPYTYTGNGSSAGLSVVAGTIEQNGDTGPEWLIAVKNAGADPVCIVMINGDLLDGSNATLASETVIMDSPMYLSYGSPTACIGAGETAMGRVAIHFDSGDASKVEAVHYGISGSIDPDATKLSDITAENITVADFSAKAKMVKGTLKNHSTSSSYKFPGVTLYTVDGAGRPMVSAGRQVRDLRRGRLNPVDNPALIDKMQGHPGTLIGTCQR